MFGRNDVNDTQTMKKPDLESGPGLTDSQVVSMRDAPPAANQSAAFRAASQEGASIVGETLHFKGELSVSEDLVIEGTIEGSIKQDKASLTVMPKGRLMANVEATRVFIEGKVKGDLYATECIKVRKGGEVEGNLVAPSISIEEGAAFNGSVEMRPPK